MTLLPEPRFVKDLVAIPGPFVALTIAGFDPSSGAGITADLQVFGTHGVHGVAAITALTVQSTTGVRETSPVPGQLVRETLDCLAEDMEIAGVKIGMLGTAEVVREVGAFLRRAGIPRERVVLDPVLRSSSGAVLLDEDGVAAMRAELLPAVGWVTPNLEELAVLTGKPVSSREAVAAMARELAELGRASSPQAEPTDATGPGAPASAGLHVVVTRGHQEPPDDFLLTPSGEEFWFRGSHVDTSSTHGTGCAFSSALLCRILAGDEPVEAVRGAKDFVRRALESAVPLGKGKGPVLSGLSTWSRDPGGPLE